VPVDEPIRHSVLDNLHRSAGAKMIPFGGWEMPLRYRSVQEEHSAVRNAVGLFDVSHLGLIEFAGENVHLFLNTIGTNDASLLDPGQSQYSFLLDADGHVLDDVWLYRLNRERYWMVVNAANHDKDWAWINAVLRGEVCIDRERPWSVALGTETVMVRDLQNSEQSGSAAKSQLALQGPRSRDVLLAMTEEGEAIREALMEMKRTEIIHGHLAGYDLYLARTGYTGEPMAFEIFVHPAAAPALWHALLEVGGPFGLEPIGLAARDSLRIEAGLPLYGHELAGPLELNPADAGFAPYVKLYKPFFVGKSAYMVHEDDRKARLIRFQVEDEHSPLPNQGDVVVSRKGRVIGAVTSCSIDTDGRLTGLAYVQLPYSKPGTRLGVFQSGDRHWAEKPVSHLKTGDHVQLHTNILVIKRFLNKSN
jgi:glycine hydroxymethyltransferase